MIAFWIIVGLLTLITVSIVIVPLLRDKTKEKSCLDYLVIVIFGVGLLLAPISYYWWPGSSQVVAQKILVDQKAQEIAQLGS